MTRMESRARRPRHGVSILLGCCALLAMASPVVGAGVDTAAYSRASARFDKGVRSGNPQVREKAIEEFATVPDVRTVAHLLAAMGSGARKLVSLERDHARRREELDRFEEIAGKSRSSRRPSSYLLAERRRLVSRVQEAARERDAAQDLLDALARGTALALGSLEEGEFREALKVVVERGLGSDILSLRLACVDLLAGVPARASRDRLEEILRSDPDPRVRVRAACGLVRHADPGPAAALLAALADPAWQVRSAAVASLARIRAPASIPPLLDALEREEGRVHEDALDALRALSGRDFHDNPALWRAWWEAGGSSASGGASTTTRSVSMRGRYGASFYGITTRSRSILFVLDVSGSMNQLEPGSGSTKLEVAKRELDHAIDLLEPPARFDIIFFGSTVRVWRKQMVPVSPRSVRKAHEFVEETEASGGTNLFGALRESFDLPGRRERPRLGDAGPDTLFLLSDGKATRGEFTDPKSILEEVRRWNEIRRIRIHTIGLGPDHDDELMQGLARESGGTYVRR